MDFKINLPPDDCTCDAKLFYDKYRKQVDNLVQTELQNAKATILGKKTDDSHLSILPQLAISESKVPTELSVITSEAAREKKIPLPKIKGDKHKSTEASDDDKHISKKVQLPKIHPKKKDAYPISVIMDAAREEVSSTSTEELTSEAVSKKKYVKTDLKRKVKKKKWSDELLSASEDIEKTNEEETTSELTTSSESYLEFEKESFQLRKNENKNDLLSILMSKAKKEGLDDDFIANILATAKEEGGEAGEENLLFTLAKAKKEGKLDELLYFMATAKNEGTLDELLNTLSEAGKIDQKEILITKLKAKSIKEGFDDDFMNNLLSKMRDEGQEDDLLFALSKAKQEGNLNDIMSKLFKSEDDSLFTDLVEAGKQDQKADLIAALKLKAQKEGYPDDLIDKLLAYAKEAGLEDDILSMLFQAKQEGYLNNILSALAKANKNGKLEDLLIILSEVEKTDEVDAFFSSLAKAKSDGNEWDFLNTLFKAKLSNKKIVFRNVVSKPKKESLSYTRRLSNVKKKIVIDDKYTDYDDDELYEADEDDEFEEQKIDDSTKHVKKIRMSKLDKYKQKLLFKRKYSLYNELPDIQYDAVKRHVLPKMSRTVTTDEEMLEEVEDRRETKSRVYRESFLQKVFGKKKIHTDQIAPSESISISTRYRTVQATKKAPAKIGKRQKISKKDQIKYSRYKTDKDSDEDSDESSYETKLSKKLSELLELNAEDRSEQGYLVGFRYKQDAEAIDWRKKLKKPHEKIAAPSVISSYEGEWVSRAKRRATFYFHTRKIDDLFHFLGSHLASKKPQNPIDFLILLLDKCIHFRNGLGSAPLLFEEKHVESLYSTMDVLQEGFIDINQYHAGMSTLFIKEYRIKPRTNKKNMVLRETFVQEALKWQRIQLLHMVRGGAMRHIPHKKGFSSSIGSVWSKIEVYQEC